MIKSGTSEIIQATQNCLQNPNDQAAQTKRSDSIGDLVQGMSAAVSAVMQSSQYLYSFDLEYFFPGGRLRRPIDPELLAALQRLRQNIRDNLSNIRIAGKS